MTTTHYTRPAIARRAAIVGVQDLRSIYTWQTWTFGWLLRVICQVLFFALMGRYLHSAAETRFLVIGAACVISVMETMTVVMSTVSDRIFGMLPLLVACPGDYFITYLCRNLITIITGTTTATISLFAGAAITGTRLPFPRVALAIPLIMLGAITVYLFGGFLGAIVAKAAHGRWLAFNVGYLTLTSLCGFIVPVSFWPLPLRVIAQVLPFTHALTAIRDVISGTAATPIVAQAGLEACVAVGWLVLGRLAFWATIEWARRDGSIDFAI